ncbi:hypothetical protein BDZ45DRAFT_751207 [Acephala macrosclerotiorum]|nr:hypothetical protein BDZ45DRAFT_751207 [Acephala macrosclerotiorum]
MASIAEDHHTITLPRVPLREPLKSTLAEVVERCIKQLNAALCSNNVSQVEPLLYSTGIPMFDFEKTAGTGAGVLRLVQDSGGQWKAFSNSTWLQEPGYCKEQVGFARPHGGSNSLEAERV